MRIAFCLPLLALVGAMAAACAAPAPSTDLAVALHAPAPPAPSLTRPVASLADIAGEWDIVRFEDHGPQRLGGGGLRHAYVDIHPDGMSFAIGCNHSGMPGRIEHGVLIRGAGDDGIQTAMGCGPEREARDRRFFAFFRSSPRVTLLADGHLRMATEGRELLLERASVRRLAMGPALAEISGTWRVVNFMKFGDGGHQGWGPMYAPGRVHIGEGRLGYSRCPGAAVAFAYTDDFVLRRTHGDEPAARTPCAGAAPPATEVEPMLAALLGQSPEAERVSDTHFILRSRDYAVLLTGEADYQRMFGDEAAGWERNPG